MPCNNMGDKEANTVYLKKTAGRCSAAICCDDAGTMVAAGTANTQPCGGWAGDTVTLATIYFPDQDYTKGFCPCEALSNGTLFPELVM